jgi:hypothetical protein
MPALAVLLRALFSGPGGYNHMIGVGVLQKTGCRIMRMTELNIVDSINSKPEFSIANRVGSVFLLFYHIHKWYEIPGKI